MSDHSSSTPESAPATGSVYKRAPSPDEFCENCCFPRTSHRGPMDSCPVPIPPSTGAGDASEYPNRLRLLVLYRNHEMHALAWDGSPNTARWSEDMDYLDLGDAEYKPLPAMPVGDGLHLLTWMYRVGTEEDDSEYETAFYADACAWDRPTVADLVALKLLPEALYA